MSKKASHLRQPIETAPKDGKEIWVEDDQAAYDVAHWSSETKEWVWKNGRPIRITPTHWSPIAEPQYQEDEQSSSPLQVDRVRRWFTASLIAATLVVAALISVYFRSEMVAFATRYADLRDIDDTGTIGGQEGLGTGLVRAPDAVDELSLKLLPEAASASQSFGPRETTAALVQDAGAARHAIPASTVQHRQTLEQEILRSDTLAGELAAARSELGTKVALANKAVDEAAQIRRAAEATTAELQKSLHQERERSAALERELTKAHIDLETTVALSTKSHDEAEQRSQAADVTAEELRQSLQQERARAAALTSELAGTHREIETKAAQSQKAAAEALQQKQTAEAATAELRESLQQQQKKTAALTQEVGAARQAMTASAEQQRRALDEAQARAAALASELAGTHREIETQAAQSQKAVDEALQQKQTAEAATAELRESLQQEQKKTAALTQEVGAERQAMTASAEQQRRALDEAQARAAALASELAGTRREIETQAAQPQKAVDEAMQQKQTAEAAMPNCENPCSRSKRRPPPSPRRSARRARR